MAIYDIKGAIRNELNNTQIGEYRNLYLTNKNKIQTVLAGLDINTTTSSLYDPKNLPQGYMTKLQEIQWSRGYDYDFRIEDAPAPFDWGGVLGIPAFAVSPIIAKGNTWSFRTGMDLFTIPLNSESLGQINVQIYDDEVMTVLRWLEAWMNNIYSFSYGVLPLDEAVKLCKVSHQTSTRLTTREMSYYIFPTGAIDIKYSAQDDTPIYYSVNFQIVDYLNPVWAQRTTEIANAQTMAYGVTINTSGKVVLPQQIDTSYSTTLNSKNFWRNSFR